MDIYKIIENIKKYWISNEAVGDFKMIDKVENHIKLPLPADYKYFLQWYSNGGEGNLPNGYLLLFKIEEILSRQTEYEIEKYSSSYLVFGLEGDHVFCFKIDERKRSANYRVIEIPLSCIDDPGEAQIVGEEFADFLSKKLGNL